MSDIHCSMCGEPVAPDRAIVGDTGSICVDCVWMCVDILDERGEKRPEDADDEFEETSKVYEKGSIPPPPK
ncbi:MAG TPA: ClpX C4-type zinc finger protein [Polyangiaceae bacterium]